MDKLTIRGSKFVDTQGREVLLRGVNLSGSTKTPPDEPSQIANDFSRHRGVSFVGRPFPRSEAREHFARLRHWGFNCLRFLTTWEAVEHQGPGRYDTDYLDYLAEMVALAGEYGLYVFIDPHQDVWSRMTGGDGAPGWTLEAVGFDLSTLDLSEAAITMQRRYPSYPRMVWSNNYNRLACMTMFTLFFCGNRYAPGITIEGVPVQDFLQDSFIKSMQEIAKRVKDMPHVLGYGPLNEPGRGYIGLNNLDESTGFPQHEVFVSPADSILMGAGFAREVPEISMAGFAYALTDSKKTINPYGISAWRGEDLWHKLGVWDYTPEGEPAITRKDYFAGADFLKDGLIPFTRRYAAALRETHPDSIIFFETAPTEVGHLRLEENDLAPLVNATHWYDILMLFTKSFNGETALDLGRMQIVEGREDVAQFFKDSIGGIVDISEAHMGGAPTLIGEFGLAYDMNDKHAFQDGDFSLHELALSMYYDAMDAHLAHSTQWNYTPDNSNRWGDNWNEEDLSIFSRDQQHNPADIHSGGRAVRGFSRPYVQRAAGRLLRVHFDYTTGVFTAEIDFQTEGATEIYVPDIWYPDGYRVDVSGGEWQASDAQNITWRAASGFKTVTISPQMA